MIRRILSEEEPMKLPTPIAGPVKALADLVEALLSLCESTERRWTDEDGNKLPTAMVLTREVRRVIQENT